MIFITYYFYQQKNTIFIKLIEIKGHSNFAPKGKDLICAAVSAIANGTINFLQLNFSQIVNITVGDNIIEINQIYYDKELNLCLEMMLYQLNNISFYYSQYLKINSQKKLFLKRTS